MFNQKVNHYTSQNPDYLNNSLGAPGIKPLDIHQCGTNLEKYRKIGNCNGLPLQTWCSPNTAVESFAMRPIVNGPEYFNNIKKYLSDIIFSDSIPLKKSGMVSENYFIVDDHGQEPMSSFLQTINLNVTNYLMFVMGESGNNVGMFKNINPLSESLIINDIELNTYQSTQNPNHFYHKVLFSAVNTTRYNTVSFKAEVFQDTSNMMQEWHNNINKVMNSKDLPKKISTGATILISSINLLNNTSCALGQDNDCEYSGYNLGNGLDFNNFGSSKGVDWLKPNALATGNYNNNGEYTPGGYNLVDSGPANIDQLISSFKPT